MFWVDVRSPGLPVDLDKLAAWFTFRLGGRRTPDTGRRLAGRRTLRTEPVVNRPAGFHAWNGWLAGRVSQERTWHPLR